MEIQHKHDVDDVVHTTVDGIEFVIKSRLRDIDTGELLYKLDGVGDANGGRTMMVSREYLEEDAENWEVR